MTSCVSASYNSGLSQNHLHGLAQLFSLCKVQDGGQVHRSSFLVAVDKVSHSVTPDGLLFQHGLTHNINAQVYST